jgi:thiamine-phosphate pyrophosphorylase
MSTIHDERMARFAQAGLYVVTSADVSAGRHTTDIVRAVLKAGVRLIQLREKALPVRTLVGLAHDLRTLTQRAGALLIINDRLDVAMAVGADGVHLGQDDLPIEDARALAPDMVIGASSHSLKEAIEAEQAGASYVNIGPIFPTGTKAWSHDFLGLEAVDPIARHLSIPFTVMGGIKRKHIPDLLARGVRTIAVVTAVTADDDPEVAARNLLALVRPGCGHAE